MGARGNNMGTRGFEPPPLAGIGPQPIASASSATSPKRTAVNERINVSSIPFSASTPPPDVGPADRPREHADPRQSASPTAPR